MRDARLIQNDRVFEAMKNVDRKNYVVDERYAYEDRPQSIGVFAIVPFFLENLLTLHCKGTELQYREFAMSRMFSVYGCGANSLCPKSATHARPCL